MTEKLSPPSRICGRMGPDTSEILMQERGRWMVKARTDGASLADISAALGIPTGRVAVILHQRRCKIRVGEPRLEPMLRKCGLSVGNIRESVRAMPLSDQARLADYAAKRGISGAAALVAFFVENQQ